MLEKVNWLTETSSPSLTIPRVVDTPTTKGYVMSVMTVASEVYDHFEDQIEKDDFYILIQDDFDPARFYKSLSQALIVLEAFKEDAA